MSKYSVGDNATIKYVTTGKEIEVVVTNVKVVDGYYCYMLRRKDNKQFKLKNPDRFAFNVWYKGEKVEVSTSEKT